MDEDGRIEVSLNELDGAIHKEMEELSLSLAIAGFTVSTAMNSNRFRSRILVLNAAQQYLQLAQKANEEKRHETT